MARPLNGFEVAQSVLNAIDEGAITAKDIESFVLVSQSSVRRSVADLRDGGYIEGSFGKDLRLTEAGRNVLVIVEPSGGSETVYRRKLMG